MYLRANPKIVPVLSETTEDQEFEKDRQEILRSIRPARLIIPILIGLGAAGYLLYDAFKKNSEEIKKISWDDHVLFWISMAFLILIVRHLAYANRLRVLSDGEFSWKKSIELIFIWEFSSAISPTSVGGSAVALIVLAQEKLSTAKTTSIVLYSAILDTIFFIGTLPILFFILGPTIIRPGLNSINDMDGWGYTFLGAYALMFTYGSIFFYGLFINPKIMHRLLRWLTSWGYFKKFRKSADQLGQDFIVASKEMKKKKIKWHVEAFLSTATAWSCRFVLLDCLIIAFVPLLSTDFWTQFGVYGRMEAMFVIMAFSPTPGGAGFAEIVFPGFVSDYVNAQSIAVVIAIIWRFFTYYLYLIMGAIIIPNWLRSVLDRRVKNKRARQSTTE